MNSDFGILNVSFKGDNRAKDFAHSLKNTGFAVLSDHNISKDLIGSVLNEWQGFFASDDKDNYLYNEKTFLGYFPFGIESAKGHTTKNAMEYFHHSFGVRLPKGLSNKTDDLFNQLLGLGLELLSWLESELPADIVSNFKGASLKDMVALTTVETVMRFIHYPFVEKIDSSQEVNRAHEDINFLTLLTSATGHGLQVKDLSGNWHDVGYEQDDIIVNAGDMLQMLTQGFYKSTTHRVIINPSHKRARYSMPLFIGPKGDTLLSKDLTAREYFLQRMEENGIKQISDTH